MSLKQLSLGTHLLKKLDSDILIQLSLPLTQKTQSSCLLRLGFRRLAQP